jgi:hypothetical protein
MGDWVSGVLGLDDGDFGVEEDSDVGTDDADVEADEGVATAFVFCGVAELVESAGRPPGLSRRPSQADRLPIQTPPPPLLEDVVCGTSTSSTCVIHSGTGSCALRPSSTRGARASCRDCRTAETVLRVWISKPAEYRVTSDMH